MKKIDFALVGYGSAPKKSIGRGSCLLKLVAEAFENVRIVAICDTNRRCCMKATDFRYSGGVFHPPLPLESHVQETPVSEKHLPDPELVGV